MLSELDNNIINWGSGSENTDEIPKIIWIFWDSKQESFLVKNCIERIKALHPNYEINVLNFSNINRFYPEFNYKKYSILPIANISDLIRLYLIKEYGGFWLDASILLTENLDWIVQIKTKNNSEFLGFYSHECTKNNEYPIVENWFLAASLNSRFIRDWYYEYKNCIDSNNPKLFYKNIDEEHLQGLTKPHYLLAYIAAIKIMRDNDAYSLSLINSDYEGHYYNYRLLFTNKATLHYNFLLNPIFRIRKKIVKFNSGGRLAIDFFYNKGFFLQSNALFSAISYKPSFFLNFKLFYDYIKNKLQKCLVR